MKTKRQRAAAWLVATVAFLVPLVRGLAPHGGGAGNEPVVVVVSAVMTGLIALGLLNLLFLGYAKLKKK